MCRNFDFLYPRLNQKIRRANGPKACKTLRMGMLRRLHVYSYFYMYTCAGGGPPRISWRAFSRPGFSVSDYSRTRLALFPNSFT